MPSPGICEPLDSVRGKDEVQVEWAVLELDEVLATLDLFRLGIAEIELEIPQGEYDSLAILPALFSEDVGILSRIRKTQKDGTRLSQKQIPDFMLSHRIPNLFGLAIFKSAHNRAIQAGSLRTIGGNPPLCQKRERVRHPEPVCRSE